MGRASHLRFLQGYTIACLLHCRCLTASHRVGTSEVSAGKFFALQRQSPGNSKQAKLSGIVCLTRQKDIKTFLMSHHNLAVLSENQSGVSRSCPVSGKT